MIREKGIVVKLENGIAGVAVPGSDRSKCGSCEACGGSCRIAVEQFSAPAPEGLHVGDEVVIEIPTPGAAASTTLIMLIPALLFIAGVFVATLLQKGKLLPGGEGTAFLLGGGLMALWLGGVAVYDRHLRRSPEHRPRIVERRGGGAPGHGG